MDRETPLEPRFVVWRCEHCRNDIEFDAVQLAGRSVCRVPCPHCGRETELREPSKPPPLVPDEGWVLPAGTEILLAQEPLKSSGPPVNPAPIAVTLPPYPPPPSSSTVDVRWLTDLGVVYFRQHQFVEAYRCFMHGAQRGFATAQFCLAVCYFNGQGTTQDDAAAQSWLQKAAAQNNANAEFTLAMAHSLGRGVERNEIIAQEWLQKAAQHGHPEALQKIREASPPPVVPPRPASLSPEPVIMLAAPTPAMEQFPPKHELQKLLLGLFRKK